MRPRISRQLVPPDRLREIAELAEAVAEEHCPTGRVEPQAIARAKRITTSFGAYGEAFDGMLELRDGRWHIFGNLDRLRSADAPRARFTLGHELGHWFLDEHRNALRAGGIPAHRSQCDYESPLLAEQEADHFSANLLMPARRFVFKAKAAPRGLAGVLELAENFGTSVTSTAIRYAASGIAACAVVKWSPNRFAWKKLGSALPGFRFGRTVETAADLPEGSPTRRALAGERPPACGWFQAGTTAAAWFPRVEDGDAANVILIEQAVGLGRFGVLTFLYPEGGERLAGT